MKVGLISLGCPKNLVDSEVMLGLAQQAGHELTTEERLELFDANMERIDKLQAEQLKEATTQVLSLLQTALDQTDNDGACTLKMHESTQTLLFKGSAAKCVPSTTRAAT